MTHALCRGIARSGQRCRARPIVGSDWCINHSPDIPDEVRRSWKAKGGKNSAAIVRAKRQLPLDVMTTDELRGLMGMVLRGVIAGKIDPPVANAAATVTRALAELGKVQADALIEQAEELLEELSAAMERRVG